MGKMENFLLCVLYHSQKFLEKKFMLGTFNIYSSILFLVNYVFISFAHLTIVLNIFYWFL